MGVNGTIRITDPSGKQLCELLIAPDATVALLKEMLQIETGIPVSEQQLFLAGTEMAAPHRTLASFSLTNSSTIVLHHVPGSQTQHSASSSHDAQAAKERLQLEQIRQASIEENLETALQCYPEQFAPITMLYIPCEINGVKMRAFVDSGAQSTILSLQCAQRCGLTHLIDGRFHGVARGVGAARILGKIHLAPIKIGGVFLPSSFTILDQPDMDFLLGLDMLRKFRANIDLEANALRIGGQVVPFLSERDLNNYQ